MTEPESSQDKVESTFELLAAANKLESGSDYWLATEKFVAARKILEVLAEEETQKAESEVSGSEASENARKVASLYASKADEYWKHSRRCLIRAMEQESTTDEARDRQLPTNRDGTDERQTNGETGGDQTVSCACALLDDEQARTRNHSFSVLFSRPLVDEGSARALGAAETTVRPGESLAATETTKTTGPENNATGESDDKTEDAIANEGDLEARLRALNQSLPTGFKSVDERMSDVNKGLGKLGVSSVYTQSHAPRIEDELSMTEDEQIDEILAQARDEVLMDKATSNGGDDPIKTTAINNDGDSDSSFGGDDSESENESEEDEILVNDQLAMKTIQKQVVKAQVKLAELLALVDQARSKRAKEEKDEDEEVYKNNNLDGEDSDEDSFREVQKHDVAFLMMTGKKKLKSAQRNMKKALDEWEDLIL